MIKYQNYKHYKLPITLNPLNYGKLILKIDDLNLFIVQINKTNVVIITQYEELNHVKLFKEGDLMLEYKDHKTLDDIFIRTLNNKKFTFKNNELTSISTEFSVVLVNFIVFKTNCSKLSTIKPDLQPYTQIKWKI